MSETTPQPPVEDTPETVKVGDARLVDGKWMVYNGFNWLSVKNTLQLVVQTHLRDVMDDLLCEADETEDGDPQNDGFARRLTDIVCDEIFLCVLESWE